MKNINIELKTDNRKTHKWIKPGTNDFLKNESYQHYLLNEFVVTVKGSHKFSNWGIGGWAEGGQGRLVDGAPMVKGTTLYLYQLCTAVTGGKSRHQEAKEAGKLLELEQDDTVTIDGTVFRVWVCSRGYAELEKV